MQFHFLDLSKEYNKVAQKTTLTQVRKGKFVQLRNKNCEYIIFSPVELTKYHANIVERFCRLHANIPVEFNASGDSCKILDSAWKIVGGGAWKISESNLVLYGKSMAYGSFERHKLLSENLKQKTGVARVIIK